MTARQIPHDEFEHVERGFFSGHTVVFIVATTDDTAWASQRTWEIARTATGRERRVALLDLSLEEPVLDQGTNAPSDEGIVDAFLYGVSLSHVARAQETTGLHYVGVGTRPADPAEVWSNPRWERLAQGFKKEGALLLAFVPPGALNRAALKPDGMIVLAPDGFDPSVDVAPGIRRRLQEGCALMAVVSNPPATPLARPEAPPTPSHSPLPPPPSTRPANQPGVSQTDPAPAAVPPRPPRPQAPSSPPQVRRPSVQSPKPRRTEPKTPLLELVPRKTNGTRRFLIGGGIAVILTAVFVLTTLRDRRSASAAATDPESAGAQPETTAVAAVDSPAVDVDDTPNDSTAPPPTRPTETIAAAPTATPTRARPLGEADSLFYAIQVASFNARPGALELATELASHDLDVTVTPLTIGTQGVWHRVLVGAFRSPAAAAAIRQTLWRDGLVENGQGTILRTPYSLDLGERGTREEAQNEAEQLWGKEIAAYVVAVPAGARILFGAFENTDQAQVAQSQLANATITATLVRRLGIPP
jgi:SPOR domain